MNLPNLNDVEIPKRIMAGLIAMGMITKYIPDAKNQLYAYLFVGFIVACQTATDILGKKDKSGQK